jgi:predicted DsbA family dithiol-disulfide isomerase
LKLLYNIEHKDAVEIEWKSFQLDFVAPGDLIAHLAEKYRKRYRLGSRNAR